MTTVSLDPAAVSTSPRPSRVRAFRRGLGQQADVVGALVLRETRTRFGANQLGYLWRRSSRPSPPSSRSSGSSVVGWPTPPGMTLFPFIATGVALHALHQQRRAGGRGHQR
ncbi:MAG: hypothetical protein R2939_12775 [Kofleriaceae bacterium]